MHRHAVMLLLGVIDLLEAGMAEAKEQRHADAQDTLGLLFQRRVFSGGAA